jgi:hypothetical protein
MHPAGKMTAVWKMPGGNMRAQEVISRGFVLALVLAVGANRAPAQDCGEWTVLETPDLNTDHAIIRDVAAVAPDDVWAVGGVQRYTATGTVISLAFSMHWDGESWTSIETPSPTACDECTHVTLWAVDATGPNDVWAAGDKRVQGAGPYPYLGTHILVMHWDGSAWTVMDTPLQQDASGDMVWGIEAVAPDDVWFFGEGLYPGSPTSQPALAMHWDGSNFEVLDVPVINPKTSGFGDGNALRDGSALSSEDIWAVGAASDGDSMPSPLAQIQHWDGTRWSAVPAPGLPGVWNDLNAVVAIAPDDVWVGGEYYGADEQYHGLALRWDGSSWTQVPIPGGVLDMYAVASNDVYAVGGAVMHWDGTAWSIAEAFPAIQSPSLAGVDAAGACDIWVGGRQWTNETLQPLAAHLQPNATGETGVLPDDPPQTSGDRQRTRRVSLNPMIAK